MCVSCVPNIHPSQFEKKCHWKNVHVSKMSVAQSVYRLPTGWTTQGSQLSSDRVKNFHLNIDTDPRAHP
jgi:hypothetical protein